MYKGRWIASPASCVEAKPSARNVDWKTALLIVNQDSWRLLYSENHNLFLCPCCARKILRLLFVLLPCEYDKYKVIIRYSVMATHRNESAFTKSLNELS
jgi:hypothetical protein